MRWCVYDPLLSEAQHFSTQIGFGQDIRVLPQFDKADVVLALDSDFLDCGNGDLPSVRGFTARRRVREAKDSMNRLYVVENRYTSRARWPITACLSRPARSPPLPTRLR
jgi:molybdopterin-containing oxidoreductase family iron-sulfur binding subunit